MKLLISIILCVASYNSHSTTLNEVLGVTSYLHYGGGATHLSNDAIKEFWKTRNFVDNTVCALDSMGRFSTEPTPHGNFKYDTDLRNRKALGMYNYWSTQGLMDWQEAGTYTVVENGVTVIKNRSKRKTCIPYGMNPSDPATWKDLAELCKRIAAHYNGKGILDAIGFQNEYDFKWNLWRVMTQKEYAVLFKECYKAVRSVNPTIDIYTGGSIYPNPDSVLVLLNAIKSEFAKTGEPMPTDFFFDLHFYPRNTSNDQTSGTAGVTPETAKMYELGLRFDRIVKDWNLKGFVIGEIGWSPYSGKQSAPVMQGYDSFHSQGFCTVRASFIMATIETFKGFYFWHCNEKYDASPYNFGFNYRNWTATQARIICQEYKNKYGNHQVKNYRTNGTLYAVDLIASADTTTLVWTDLNKHGEYDAKPRIGTLVTQPPTEPEPPIPPDNILKVSLSANPFPNSVPLNGFKAESGEKLYIYWDGTGKTPFTFQPSGQRESGAPYEYLGGKPVAFPDGTHTVTITDGNNVLIGTATFTVGTIVEPQEDVIKIWYEDGKIFYKTEKRTISNYAE